MPAMLRSPLTEEKAALVPRTRKVYNPEIPRHRHDVSSMIEGLELATKLMTDRCKALKPDYITELKQSYGTVFMARHGTMMRAGDTPYNPEANFLRTLHVQAYTPLRTERLPDRNQRGLRR